MARKYLITWQASTRRSIQVGAQKYAPNYAHTLMMTAKQFINRLAEAAAVASLHVPDVLKKKEAKKPLRNTLLRDY